MMKKKFPFYRQLDRYDCGPTCLRMLAKYYGKNHNIERLRQLCGITVEGVSARGLIEGAESIGLQTLPTFIDFEVLSKQAPLPCISYWEDRHFLIVYKITKKWIYVADPDYGLAKFSKEEYIKHWQNRKDDKTNDKGLVILLEPTPDFYKQDEDEKNSSGLRLILSYISKDSRYVIQMILGLIAGTIIQLAFPFLTQAIVDQGISSRDLNFIYVILIAQITLFFSSSAFSLIQGWLLLFVGSRASIMIASNYLRKLLKKSLSFFDSKTPGDIVQRMNDSSRIEALISSVPGTLFSYINAVVFLFILLYYNVTIFIVFTLGIILYIIWVQYFMKKREELDYKRFQENAGTNTTLMQMVSGVQEIKVNNSELRRIWAWEEIRIRLYKTQIATLKLSQFQIIGGNVINELKNIIVTFLAAKGVIDGSLTLGMMLAIQYIVGQINVPLNSVIQFLRQLQDARLSLERFTDIDYLSEEEKLLNKKGLANLTNEPQDIIIENLSFRYGGNRSPMVLKNINLIIPKGKVTAIVGMSGGGKTTLLKVLLKLYLPTEGKITIDGINLNNIDTHAWRKQCGTVMQSGYIFSDTIVRNITESNSFGDYNEEKIVESATLANIVDFIEDHPAGYNARIGPIGSSGRSLSGGQAQRILLARAIYKNPKYILLDEATSALDANNEKKIMQNLKAFYNGKTVIIVAHRMSTVRNADQIVVLHEGKIAEKGKHDELINRKGAYFTLIKNQLEVSK